MIKYFMMTALLFILLICSEPNLALAGSTELDMDPLQVSQEMVHVEGGCYIMGDTFSETPSIMHPAHEICLDDYYMSKYEVTVGAFRAFVNETDYRTEAEWQDGCHSWEGRGEKKKKEFNWLNTNFPQTENDPVVCVSWNDSYNFIQWFNHKTGKNFRLPTEAEWEYAARSRGKEYRFSWGNGTPSDNIADETANRALLLMTESSGYTDGYSFTSPVGSFSSNEIGLHDMSGNVYEWAADWFGKDYYKTSPKHNPQGTERGTTKVLRGGSWNPLPSLVKTTDRRQAGPGARGSWMGFRLAHPANSFKKKE